MKKRIHLKRQRKKWSKARTLGITLLLVLFCCGSLLSFLGNKINPILLSYAQIETERFAKTIIDMAVTEELTAYLSEEELFSITENTAGEIQTVDFNPAAVTKVLSLTVHAVRDKLKAAEEGKVEELDLPDTMSTLTFLKLKDGIVCEIPIGVIFGNSIVANFGPTIPVRLYFLGDVIAHLNTKIESYGINNALVTISVTVEVSQQITMPLMTTEETLTLDIPIALKMVQGRVPTYYQNGFDKNSNLFSLPME